MKKNVTFYSEGFKIAADLYLPDHLESGKKTPAVILCHGFCGTKEVLLPSFAEGFAKEGFLALVFDYRGFGQSEGERGRLVPLDQVTDIRNAITFMHSLPEADTERTGLWGTSFGGANAIYAASQDTRVKALVVQLTFGNGERVVSGNMSQAEREKLEGTLSKVWMKTVTQNKPMMLAPSQILTDEDSKLFFGKLIESHPEVNVKIPFFTIQRTMEHKPENLVPHLNIPIQILGAEEDIVNPPAESRLLFEKAKAPKELVMIKGAKHYEVYSGEKFKEAFEKEAAWFKKYLG